MLNIYNIHLVVTGANPSRITHRNCIDYNSFERFLASSPIEFIKMKNALRTKSGDVLTIDDATAGAFDAAMLCAAYKQYVTLFINPYYVETGRQYYMHYLSQLIEDLGQATFSYNGKDYNLLKQKEQKHLRKAMKETLCSLATENERVKFLEQEFGRKVSSVSLPYHLRTMTKKQLQTLLENKFVSIEYHGWTHTGSSSLSVEQHILELSKGKEWFKANLHSDIHYFALPFGKRDNRLEDLQGFPLIFLEDSGIDQTRFKHNVINRRPFEPLFEQWRISRNDDSGSDNPVYSADGTVLVKFPNTIGSKIFSIPDTVSIIGAGAFDRCDTLKQVEIPSSVRFIERNAFAHTGLESIHIPDSVEGIGDLCFYSCKNLKSIRLSENLLEIGGSAFSDCTSLESIDMPKSLKKLGDGLFMGCSALKTVNIPKVFPQFKSGTFIDCSPIVSIRRSTY